MTEQVFVLPFEQSLPLHRDPLASCFKAWAAIPAVSSWVLNKIQQGYSLQFSRRLQRCYSNFCSRQRNSRSPTRSTDIACKRCRGNHAPREQQLRLFQLLLTRSKERWWAQTHSGSQTSELLAYAPVVQDVNYQTDPSTHLPRVLIFDSGTERRIFSHPHSPPSQTVLEIRVRGSGLSVCSPSVWTVSGNMHFYELH